MANWAGCAVRREASVDSTNRAARRWAAQGAPHGAAVVALAQTAGPAAGWAGIGNPRRGPGCIFPWCCARARNRRFGPA